MKITIAQALILKHLLMFEEIRERAGGFFEECTLKRISIKAANGLIARGLLVVNTTHTMPSCGLAGSPVLNSGSVTKAGREALLDFIHHLGWELRSKEEWYHAEKDIQRGIEEVKTE